MFGMILYDVIFFSIPVILIIFFGISLYRYVSAKKQNDEAPDTFSREEIYKRKIILIIASVLAGAVAAVAIGFISLLFMAVAFM